MVESSSEIKNQVLVGDADISSDSISSIVTLRENAVDSCMLVANDEKGKQYLSNIQLGKGVVIKYKYADKPGDIWHKVFSGSAVNVNPKFDKSGEVIGVDAYGTGYPLKKMRVLGEFGNQINSYSTLSQIVNYFVPNYVNKVLGTSTSSGYNINTDYVYGYLDSNEIPYITFPYEDGFTCLQDLLRLENSMRYSGSPTNWQGLHWIVDPDSNLIVAPVGNHAVSGSNSAYYIESKWPTYAQTNPLYVTQDMLVQDFVTKELDANYVLYAGKYTYPKNGDAMTETTASEWFYLIEINPSTVASITDEFSMYTTGTGSIKFHVHAVGDIYSNTYFLHQITGSIGWPYVGCFFDFTKLIGYNEKPSINLWIRNGANVTDLNIICTCLTGSFTTNSYFAIPNFMYYTIQNRIQQDTWVKITINIGDPGWVKYGYSGFTGDPWSLMTHIGVAYTKTSVTATDADLWIDGLQIVGTAIRGAYDSTSIAANGCKTATVKDSLSSTSVLDLYDDTSGLGQFCLAQLLQDRIIRTTGKITIPLSPTFMAGQLVPIRACRNADPNNFGYTEIGSLSADISDPGAYGEYVDGTTFMATKNGTIDSITLAAKATTNCTDVAKAVIYKQSDLSYVGATKEVTLNYTTNLQWFTLIFTGSKPTVTSGSKYILMFHPNATAQSIYMGYDNDSSYSGMEYYKQLDYPSSYPNPLAPDGSGSNKYSIYASYDTWNINKDFRITEVEHRFTNKGAFTLLTLTDDLKSSIVPDNSNVYNAIAKATSPDFQTRTYASLKAGGTFDLGLPLISKNYPS